jgi:hypothetical protein
VRLWQLSQQAVCGLVVGCLRQPRYRPRRGGQESEPKDEAAGELKKKIEGLERELDGAKRLIEVLRELPGNREAKGSAGVEASGRNGERRKRVAAAADRGAAPVAGTEASNGQRA